MYPGLALAGQPPANRDGKGEGGWSATSREHQKVHRAAKRGTSPAIINLAEEPTLQPVSMCCRIAHLWTLTTVLPTVDVNINISMLRQRYVFEMNGRKIIKVKGIYSVALKEPPTPAQT